MSGKSLSFTNQGKPELMLLDTYGILTKYKPVKTIGDGICLYRVASMELTGSENNPVLLRLMSALEIIQHKPHYDVKKSNIIFLNDVRIVAIAYTELVRQSVTLGLAPHSNAKVPKSEYLRTPDLVLEVVKPIEGHGKPHKLYNKLKNKNDEMPHKLSFKVTHASGQDEVHRASELNFHSPLTKGWQSARYCLYPQDIVIHLEKRSRLRKIQVLSHQCLIATRIEFFVGDVPDGMPVDLDNARYTRLGYVSLSDNEKTGFKARELKSVQVDAVGVFLKLNIHKNHINKYNIYNQVGLVAVNVIGDPIRKGLEDIDDMDLFTERRKVLDDPSMDGLYNRGKIRKRQAVENEDYDKAKLKKAQMDEYRVQIYRDLNVPDLLETTGSRHPKHIDLESTRQPTPPRLLDLPRTPPSPPPRTPYDERPLPAIKSQRAYSPLSPRARTPYDERPLPIHKRR
ncbi:CE104-like protein [Mya arenaria]|uniref:CE104-like protein n=1 Tax=Mya arenaria TaxID=6604 RepID=A0ABY7F3U3_MYAAR|nr:CE104-like protein [Mya arenaria]